MNNLNYYHDGGDGGRFSHIVMQWWASGSRYDLWCGSGRNAYRWPVVEVPAKPICPECVKNQESWIKQK